MKIRPKSTGWIILDISLEMVPPRMFTDETETTMSWWHDKLWTYRPDDIHICYITFLFQRKSELVIMV